MNRQTLIPVSADTESSFSSFHAGGNTELLAELRRMVHGVRAKRVLYFWGEAGSGKTHLLNACCQLALESGAPHAYLPVDGATLEPARLEQIAPQALVCIDDFQAAAASDSWQVALFNLYEKLHGHAGALVVASDRAVGALNLALKDLESRLVSGGVFRLARLTEADQRAALKARARHKGFELTDPVLQFILTHFQRDTASLFALLDRIDNASLAQQRKITVPFIKSLLQTDIGQRTSAFGHPPP